MTSPTYRSIKSVSSNNRLNRDAECSFTCRKFECKRALRKLTFVDNLCKYIKPHFYEVRPTYLCLICSRCQPLSCSVWVADNYTNSI